MTYSTFAMNYEYPDNYFTLLTDAQADILTDAYEAYVAEHPNNVLSLFSYSGNPLVGYEMPLEDYIFIMSFPGVQQWVLRFGYIQQGRLQLILVGKTLTGIKMTPNILLTQAFTLNLINPVKVPKTLYDSWIQAYINLVGQSEVRAGFLQSPFESGNILKGFTFNFSDFLSELYSDGQLLPTGIRIKFNIVNHAMAVTEGPSQASLPGMIGVALCAVVPGNSEIRYYDISAPCPPTCP